jgi:hypothetical protein
MTEQDLTALFQKEDNDMAEVFRDKIQVLFNHFDRDKDGHLKFAELAALQRATEGVILSEEMYLMACKALDCKPGTGVSLPALKLTYAAQGGADFEKDYLKVFPKKKATKESNDEEQIYEVGDDGAIDISS